MTARKPHGQVAQLNSAEPSQSLNYRREKTAGVAAADGSNGGVGSSGETGIASSLWHRFAGSDARCALRNSFASAREFRISIFQINSLKAFNLISLLLVLCNENE